MNPILFSANQINMGFNMAVKPLQPMPVFLTDFEKRCRGGLNKQILTAEVVNAMGQAGINTAPLPNGQDNQICLLAKILCDKIIEHIQTHSSVEASVDMMGTTIISQGGNAGGPIVTQGTNYLPIMARGYVR